MEAKFREKDEREEQLVKAKEKLENEEEIDATVLVGTNTCIASMRT